MERIKGILLGDLIEMLVNSEDPDFETMIEEITDKVRNIIRLLKDVKIYHRDITYDNLIIDDLKNVWVLDFGRAFMMCETDDLERYYGYDYDTYIDTLTDVIDHFKNKKKGQK